jgi:hypothetical protein
MDREKRKKILYRIGIIGWFLMIGILTYLQTKGRL